MDDRLKFRVWDIEEKTYKSSDRPFFLCDDGKVLDTHFDIRDNEVTVEQCTGLKDKNGKLIYEGDIVHYIKHTNLGLGGDRYAKVFWWDNVQGFAIETSYGDYYGLDDFEIEVVGNIHENADLLKNPGNFNVSAENVKGDNK